MVKNDMQRPVINVISHEESEHKLKTVKILLSPAKD